jgi:hypothetical protein
MSERNKVTGLGENINNPLYLHPRNLGRDAPRPTLLKRRGGKSQGKGEAVHNSDPTDATAGGQAFRNKQPSGGVNLEEGCFRRRSAGVRRLDQSGPGGETVGRAYSACVICISSSLILNFIFFR